MSSGLLELEAKRRLQVLFVTVPLYAQVMDLPADLWNIVQERMSPIEWALARGTLVAADVHGELGESLQDLTLQLQIHGRPLCQSLCINLEQLHKAASVTLEQALKIRQAGGALPRLRCLHIIGRDHTPLITGTGTANNTVTVEGVLLGLLGMHASVLTLQVARVSMPLNFPRLQHLVLDLDPPRQYLRERCTEDVLFPEVSMLTTLKTLYVRCHGCLNLTSNMVLQRVVVQGASFQGLPVVPIGCFLHVVNMCGRSGHGELSRDVAHLVNGLTAKHIIPHGSALSQARARQWHVPQLSNLKRLRLISYRGLNRPYNASLKMAFSHEATPCLEALELERHGSLAIYIDPALALEELVLIAAESLNFIPWDPGHNPLPIAKQMYWKSGAAILQKDRSALEATDAPEPWAGRRLEHFFSESEEQNAWTLQMPAGFQPSNLEACCCEACPECLVKAGVPIVCNQAWTSKGFEKHLRPQCSGQSGVLTSRAGAG